MTQKPRPEQNGGDPGYRALVEALPQAVLLVQGGEVVLANRRADEMLGLQAGDRLDEQASLTCLGRQAASLLGVYLDRPEPLEGAGPHTVETEIACAARGQFPAQVSLTHVEHRGRPALQLVVNDISEQMAARDELARRAQDLARSNAELQNFAFVASHDLREPLDNVVGFLELLSRRYRQDLPEKAREFIDLAQSGARRMHEMIGDLLDFSRVQTQGRPLEPTDLGQTLEQALANLERTMREAGARVELEGELPVVLGDALQLERLLRNLIENAVRFRREEAPRIRIAARRGRRHWLIEVADNGQGMEPKDGERVFHIFQRLGPRREGSGTGMGLAICQRIVERHGGRIWLESTPGEGTTFFFTLTPLPDQA